MASRIQVQVIFSKRNKGPPEVRSIVPELDGSEVSIQGEQEPGDKTGVTKVRKNAAEGKDYQELTLATWVNMKTLEVGRCHVSLQAQLGPWQGEVLGSL